MKTENRHWLILSYFSRIDGMACAQHIDDRLPYLRKSGISPIMLTSVCATRHEGLVHRRVPSVAPSGIRYELRHLRRRSRVAKVLAPLINVLSLPFYLIEKIIVDLDSQWSWFPLAAWRGRALCREFAPELIYSTGGASSAHVAAFIISRMTGIPWIAELQDPLVYGDSTRSRRAQRLYGGIVSLMCRHASAVVFLTEEARRRAAASTKLGDKGRVIYPGADPAIMPDAPYQRGERCCFAHFGSLGGTRNLRVFLQGLRLLFEERPELAGLIHVDLYGTADRTTIEDIRAFPYPGVIRNFGRIPRKDSLIAMKRSDVLLLIQNTDSISTETIPSKVYEYLHAGRPIVGLVHENEELQSMLVQYGHHGVSADDPASARWGIHASYEQWAKDALTAGTISSYTVESAVSRLVAACSDLKSRGEDD